MRPPPPVCYFTGVALPSLKFPCSSACQWPRQTKKTACCHQWPTSGLDVGGVPCCFSRGNVVFKLWGMVKGVSVSYYHTLENEKTHGLKWSSDIGECNCYILLEMVSFQKKLFGLEKHTGELKHIGRLEMGQRDGRTPFSALLWGT